MKTTYPITANCNFDSRDDATGKSVHAALMAVDAGLTDDATLVEAMGSLESVLADLAEKGDVQSQQTCTAAEEVVARAWSEGIQEAVEATRQSRYAD